MLPEVELAAEGVCPQGLFAFPVDRADMRWKPGSEPVPSPLHFLSQSTQIFTERLNIHPPPPTRPLHHEWSSRIHL